MTPDILALCLTAVLAPQDFVEMREHHDQPQSRRIAMSEQQLRLRKEHSSARHVRLRHELVNLTPKQLKQSLAVGVWHPGVHGWAELLTPVHLEFGSGDKVRDGRFLVPPGRYVVSILRTDEEGHSRMLLTPLLWVDAAGIEIAKPQALLNLGGIHVPVDIYESDGVRADLSMQLTGSVYTPGAGEMRIAAGGYRWNASFRDRPELDREPHPDARAAEAHRAAFLRERLRLRNVSADLVRVLTTPEPMTIYALAPHSDGDEEPGPRFHGYRVLGRHGQETGQPLSQERSRTLRELLVLGILSKIDDAVDDCFFPRHGVRIHGKNRTTDLVICFECSQANVHVQEKGDPKEGFTTTGLHEPAFSAVFRELGLRIAK